MMSLLDTHTHTDIYGIRKYDHKEIVFGDLHLNGTLNVNFKTIHNYM